MNSSEDVAAVRQALTKLMAIADRLETRNEETVRTIDSATAALGQGVTRLNSGGEQFAERALQVIGNSTQQTIAQGASQAVGQLSQQLRQSAESAQAAARVMEAQSRELNSARRTLVWNGLIALIVGSLLAAGGSAWIAYNSMQEVDRASFGKDILQATQHGAITRCGDVLCAKVGKNSKRYDKNADYVLLQE